MHKRVLAQRQAAARERLVALAEELADQHGVDPKLVKELKTATHRNLQLKALFRNEALIPILEAVLAAGHPAQIRTAGDFTVDELEQALAREEDPAVVQAMLADERAGKGRKTAVALLEARLAALAADEEE